jgi:hypothetical protein
MNDQGKQRLIHEAKFVRAFVYYLLINLFGEVPLVVSSDYTVNQTLGKTSVPLLYSFLVADLLSAAEYLPLQYATYPLTGSSPIRATKFAAMMLLSRIYLLQENWSMADHYCSQVLLSNKFMLEPVTKTFALNSREAIWTLQPVSGTYNTAEGYYFNTGLSAQRPAYLLSNELAGSFDTTDARFKAWLRPLVLNGKTFYTSNKYKVYKSEQLLEVNTVFRLAEAYLIRAEARLHTNRVAEAITDLNIIRSRANLFPLSNDLSSQQLLFAVEQERKLEYFMEWGMRFFDLKRWASQHTNSRLPLTRADDVLSALVKGVWQSYKLLLPIPDGEIRKLPNVTQNTGY